MDGVRIEIAGDRQAGLLFEQFPDALYDDLRKEIESLANELFARVVAATPDKTGRLRSEEHVRVYAEPESIRGVVSIGATGNEAAKAGALEYGAHRAGNVKSHSMKLDHVFDRALSAPMDVIVKAFPRTPNIAEHAFERGPLDEMRGEIESRLNGVIEAAVAKANG